MKWSQGLCASILMDGLYAFSPPARSHPQLDRDFSGFLGHPAFTSNALAADWRLSPQDYRTLILNLAKYGLAKPRLPVFWG
jgi:hypothetical protein